jgi:uncharacterized protein YceH (UPF0502 family)
MKKYQSTDIPVNINGGKERESQQSSSVTRLQRNETQRNNRYLLLFSLPAGARADDNASGPGEPVNVTSFLIKNT